ncbi:acid phosphatase/Vanadium-dependent haloperoxidase [Aureobasidium sp. EXF-8845]|nr:acid phosphatase/Vanadium-dependent haloperoxidase [Aureobasidium sp. EXF-8845]KAI4845846.1 acid phosphatase/Vanadium-dependent haloperoxidase [Aureobasidium sp. EXF-8846]
MAIDMPPTRLILAYVLDWVLLIAIVAVAGGISFITPYHRPFSLIDLAISYPYVESDEISTALLVVLALILPAIVIAIVTAFFVPAFSRSNIRDQRYWKRKLWEFNAGWMGLGLSFALAFFITTGIKNLIGKPRPDLLARCQPDLNDIAAHVVGGYGQDISQRWTLVSSSICTTTDKKRLDEGFRSFLSGHSSMSWSGLLYLSLWLASKFNMLIPYLGHGTPAKRNEEDDTEQEARERAAAPPVFGAIIVLIPVCLAFYICSTRYVDFKHQGIDIFSGSVLGIMTAWIGFRWYHGSLTRGQPWTWSPRSRDRAFAVSSGTNGWTSGDGIVMRERMQRSRDVDVEAGGSGDPIIKP